jgi:recombination protein RecA
MKTVAVQWGEERSETTAEAAETGTAATSIGELAAPGRLIEVSGLGASARHTTAAALVRQAQLEGETTAWIQPEGGSLFPPDLAESGIDLEALVVIHVPRDRGEVGLARAAELLLRSGAFGLCVLDLSEPPETWPQGQTSRPSPRSEAQVAEAASGAWREGQVHKDMSQGTALPPRLRGAAWQARLAGLARLHHSRVVVLTRKGTGRDSLGPLVGLRVDPRRERQAPGVFAVRPAIVKHKGAPLRTLAALRRGPWGLV